jgi:hypothetical protein
VAAKPAEEPKAKARKPAALKTSAASKEVTDKPKRTAKTKVKA